MRLIWKSNCNLSVCVVKKTALFFPIFYNDTFTLKAERSDIARDKALSYNNVKKLKLKGLK